MFNPDTVDAINWALCWFILGGFAAGLTVWACMHDGRVRVEDPNESGVWPL
jgi:hypothetical protein